MKKIISFVLVLLCLCLNIKVYAVANFELVLEGNVIGNIGSVISEQDVSIKIPDTVDGEFIVDNLVVNTDITTWFTNIPDDLNCKIKSRSEDELVVRFYGQLDDSLSEDEYNIVVNIPSGIIDTSYLGDINECIDNSNSFYTLIDSEILVYYDGPYTVSGFVGEQLTPQIVRVVLEGDDFIPTKVGTILSTTNGLTATITDYDDVNCLITITYTGTPIHRDHDLIHTTLTKDILDSNIVDRVVPDRIDVKFDINRKHRPRPIIPIVIEEEVEEVKVVNRFVAPKTGID